jgi:hypothetical protein
MVHSQVTAKLSDRPRYADSLDIMSVGLSIFPAVTFVRCDETRRLTEINEVSSDNLVVHLRSTKGHLGRCRLHIPNFKGTIFTPCKRISSIIFVAVQSLNALNQREKQIYYKRKIDHKPPKRPTTNPHSGSHPRAPAAFCRDAKSRGLRYNCSVGSRYEVLIVVLGDFVPPAAKALRQKLWRLVKSILTEIALNLHAQL